MLDQDKLEVGSIYLVSALNFSVAIWTGKAFKGPTVEYKVLKFTEELPYWEGLPNGTCTPLEKISVTDKLVPPFDGMNLLKVMKTLNDYVERK